MKTRLLASSGFLAICLSLPVTALAQDAPAEEEARQETVRVTGSRIAVDPNVVSSVPIQSVDDEDIRLSGEVNLADVVNDIPALISSLTAENSATGANALNLRGLGSDRTLTLVNGRRHVAGFRGSSAVDIGTIPRALVERVEVTTGGASAVYGADAVTGVVNFILKDDFEGFEVDLTTGLSSEGDAGTANLEALYGQNFNDDRGNIVFSLGYETDAGLTYGDRDWSRDNGIATVEPGSNPELRLQPGDLGPDTPNFNDIFGTYGDLILSQDFGGVDLTPAEQALIERAENAPARAVIEDARFWLTSQEGSIAPTFGGRDTIYIDVNDNGIPDCQESRGGQTGFLAGCWVTNPDGSIRVFEDGQIVTGGLWGTGGDGGRLNFNEDSLFPETDKLTLNLNVNYQLPDGVRLFFEGKYVNAESTSFAEQDSF